MKIESRKLTLGITSCLLVLSLVTACEGNRMVGFGDKEEISDCSSIFETRYVDNDRGIASKETNRKERERKLSRNKEGKMSRDQMISEANKPATTCKILEVKIDSKTKCEVVGSNRITNFTKAMEEDRSDRIILVIPQEKLNDLKKITEHYIMSTSIDVSKYLDSDVVKGLDFPYKGMRCSISGKDFVVWSGDKRVILSINM